MAEALAEVDLVLTRGRFTTLNRAQPEAEAVAIRAGRFVFVGPTAEALALAGARTRVIDLGGRRVLPGLIDNHLHIIRGGLNFNLPATTSTGANVGALAYTLLGANFSLDIELTALQQEGRGEVLSNPRVVTSNQREAIIRQGREVGYVTLTGGGNQAFPTPNVQFKDVVLELKVTPTITSDDRVFMAVAVKKDEVLRYIDTSIGQIPEIATREINTAVLVDDGQTVVIGGVYEFTDANSVSKVPFLGDVPFLGTLFKKKSRSKEKAELLIFLTPKVMRVEKRA